MKKYDSRRVWMVGVGVILKPFLSLGMVVLLIFLLLVE